jgi:hypothetical protein
MALSTPRTLYGVHSLTLYNRSTFEPFGLIKIVGNLEIALSSSFNDLNGGSSRYPWDTEAGVIDTQISGTIKEIPDFAFEKFLGATATATAAEAAGNIGSLTNKNGTTVSSGTTGVASIAAISGSEADLKDGVYVIKAASATTIDLYCMTDVDFDKGTDKAFESDLLKITASPLTVGTSTTVNVTGFGLQLTGGSAPALTTGDTATFSVRKINAGNSVITVGASSSSFNDFGAFIASQKKSNGDVFDVQLFKCKAIGLPLGFSEAEWLNSDLTIKALYDSAENAVMRLRHIKGA